MNSLITILIFFAAVILVIKGGDFFVGAAGRIAKAAGIPPFIVGATIVSLATTMPEMLVSVIAAAQGKADMAIGNAVGSVTANVGLIMGIVFCFLPVVIKRREYISQCVTLVLCAAVLLPGSLRGSLSLPASSALVLLFCWSMFQNVLVAKKSADEKEEFPTDRKQISKNILLFLTGITMIVIGSRLLVDSGSEIARLLGVPERIIAFTLVAIGTSIPELVTAITAIRKRQSALSVGNIIGANIIDLSLILPICSLVAGRGLPISKMILKNDLPACLGIILLALVPLLVREKASRAQGIILLLAYAFYLVLVI